MAFSSFHDAQRAAGPVSDINMVPLIDVLLVLLAIFIVSAPLLTQAVKVDLPKASALPPSPPVEAVNLSIDAQGGLFWNGEAVSREQLQARCAEAAAQQTPPALHVRADQNVPYRHVAWTLAEASRAGLTRIGFVSVPLSAASPAATP